MKTTLSCRLFSVATALLALPATASASIIASESFEGYNTGALTGAGGGTGWTGNWTAPGGGAAVRVEVADTSAAPMTYAVPGGDIITGATRALEIQLATTGNQPCGVRTLATPIAQTFYVGYLVRYHAGASWAGANNTFTLHLGTNSSSTTTLNFGLRGGGGNDFIVRYGTGAPVGGAAVGGALIPGADYYLVLKVNYDAGAFTSAIMWTNPPADGEVAKPAGDAALPSFSCGPITHVFWREAALQTDDVLRVDELKFGTTFNDVVPLPAAPPVPQVRVETAADGSGTVVGARTVTAGSGLTVYAIARDAGGNFISNTVAGWSLQNVTGGVGGGDLAAAPDGQSAVFTAHLIGTCTVRATANATQLVESGTLTVAAGPPATVGVETQPDGSGGVVPAQFLTTGSGVTAFAVTRDVGGNFLANVPATWSMPVRTSGVALGDLVAAPDNLSAAFLGYLSGTATIRASYGGLTSVDSGLLTVSRAVTWSGGLAGNAWDFSTLNWNEYGTATRFYDQDDVTFDGGGSMSPAVNIVADVSPHSINVTGGPYTIGGGGRIVGTGALTNSSGTRLTLLTANTYAGATAVIFNSELQLGDGAQNGSLGLGNVTIGTGGVSPIFNRTDTAAAPYVVSNTISGPLDFAMEIKTGAVELKASGANNRAKAIVRSGATLILSSAGTDLGAGTVLGGFGATNLIVEAGALCRLGTPNAAGDHLTAAGRYVYVDGIFDANGSSEAFGILLGNGTLDNTAAANSVFTLNQGSADTANGGIGNAGEIYTFGGMIRNSGAGRLGITKDGTNTLILTSANTYGGDTRVIAGGVLELGNVNAIQNSTYDQQTGDTGTLSFGSLTSATLGGLKSGANKTLLLENNSGAPVALTIGGNGQTNAYAGNLSGSGRLAKSGAGIQTLSGTSTYTGPTAVSQGTLLVNGSLSGSGSVTVSGGATLGGSGSIAGPVSVSGALRPGNNNIGKLTVNNAVTLAGTTLIEISRTSTANSDNLTATSIVLGGTLTVTNLTGTLQPGDAFQLFSGQLTGKIAVGELPVLGPGLSWDTNALNTAGVLAVVGAPEPPAIGSVILSGNALVMSGSGGAPGATYYVVSTNNITVPLASWPPISTNSFAADGKFTNSISINPEIPQGYFGIRVP